jgi:hypothetical protein
LRRPIEIALYTSADFADALDDHGGSRRSAKILRSGGSDGTGPPIGTAAAVDKTLPQSRVEESAPSEKDVAEPPRP